jgi:putative NADPH-quinone reductase
MFWYSTPSILKEWQDIVLEHGFAYGADGVALNGKRMLLAITAAGTEDAYSPGGFQHYPIRFVIFFGRLSRQRGCAA